MKQFYNIFSSEKVSPMGTQLTWSHCRALLSIKDYVKINYYINLTINNNLSKRELEEKIKYNEYERIPKETKDKILGKEKLGIKDFIKELGSSFCFIGSEYKIKIGDRYNYIDLLLYNIKFKCYVVVELKKTYRSNSNLYELWR